jgi:ribosomal protein L40E
MDISKFNQELAYKVARATGFEKNQRLKEAVQEWIEITEMVIKISKLPKLEFSFRSMLIEKTEQIINHIKELKQRSPTPLQREPKKSVIRPSSTTSVKKVEIKPKKEKAESKAELFPSIQEQKHPDVALKKEKDVKIIKSDSKNLPKGFKEIETSDDFTIITPHDQEYVKKILNQDIDMSVFKHPDADSESNTEKSKFKGKSPVNPNKLICFACGAELPLGTKVCPDCGTKLS